MEEKKNDIFIKLYGVPEVFWSDLTNQPFKKCVKCEKNLLKAGVDYMIEKAIKQYPDNETKSTIFEYAMCMECAQAMSTTMSVSSMMNLKQYYDQHVNYQKRREQLNNNFEVNHWLENCIIHNKPATPSGEYQIYAQCQGNSLIFGDYPLMIRGEAIDELIELLSAETLDELDNFKDDITSGPPEFQEILKSGPRVLV